MYPDPKVCVIDDCGSNKGLYTKFKTFLKPLSSFSRLKVILFNIPDSNVMELKRLLTILRLSILTKTKLN